MSPGSYYGYSDIGNGSGHLCPQCVPVQPEQSVFITVSLHSKSPPAQPLSAPKTQLITSTYMPYLAKPTAGRDFCFKPREGCREAAFRIIILRGVLPVFTRSSITSLRGTWHASSCLSLPGETEHLKPALSGNTHCAQGLTPHQLTSFRSLCSSKMWNDIYIYYPCNWFCQPEIVSHFYKLAMSEIWIF